MTRFLAFSLFFLCLTNVSAQKVFNPDSIQIKTISYTEFQNRYFDIQDDSTTIINIWASWCQPCRLEMPYFEKLKEEFADKKVRFLTVTIDRPEQVDTKARAFLILNEITIETVYVKDKVSALKWIPLICPDWGGTIPVTIVMNKDDGTYFEASFESYEKLKAAVLPFVKK
jgi:thiol-disulfide isomerase/thioredoxin